MGDKITAQFAILIVSFFGLWFGLSQIDFINEDRETGFARQNEKKLGEMILETMRAADDEIKNEKLRAVIDSIKVKICRTKAIGCDDIKIHVLRSQEINAFALPDNHMIIYTGLIGYAEHPGELAGVMAHEIGHMEKNHVMKKLVKNVGLEMLFAMIGGDAGFEIVRQTGKTLSSSAFDRKQEQEADAYAVEVLANANIDPQHMSNFFFRISQKYNIPSELAWISSHPDSKERAAEIIRKKKEYEFTDEPIFDTSWEEVQRWVAEDATKDDTAETPVQ